MALESVVTPTVGTKCRWGMIKAAICGQHLATSQKQLPRKATMKNLHALYRTVLNWVHSMGP